MYRTTYCVGFVQLMNESLSVVPTQCAEGNTGEASTPGRLLIIDPARREAARESGAAGKVSFW